MPFLRFSRDRRGYETTALVHSFRRQGRSHQRILYWFRTPIDARVGRPALDEDAIRLIEEHHPDVSFDWPKILEVNPAAADAVPARQEPAARPESGRRERPAKKSRAQGRDGRDERRESREERPEETAGMAETAEAVAGATADDTGPELAEPPETPVGTAAQQTFSIEDLARLRGRHAALLARIDGEIGDEQKAETLRQQAEALNPDTWVTSDDVREALERYEQVYRELRQALGRRRPRSRGRVRQAEQAAGDRGNDEDAQS